MPKVQPPELKKFMDKKLSGALHGLRAYAGLLGMILVGVQEKSGLLPFLDCFELEILAEFVCVRSCSKRQQTRCRRSAWFRSVYEHRAGQRGGREDEDRYWDGGKLQVGVLKLTLLRISSSDSDRVVRFCR